jgi:hypothetical protein
MDAAAGMVAAVETAVVGAAADAPNKELGDSSRDGSAGTST